MLVDPSLKNHVFYTDFHLIKEICEPLRKLHIYGCVFARRFNNGQFIFLSNEIEWPGSFLEKMMKEMYSSSELYQLMMDDTVDLWALHSDNTIWKEGQEFGFGNGISFYKHYPNYTDIICFFTKKNYYEMNAFYLENIGILKKFSDYFMKNIKKVLLRGEQSPLIIPSHYLQEIQLILLQTQNKNQKEKPAMDKFLSEIDPGYRQSQDVKKMSTREMECIKQCAFGKSAKQIADELFLSRRTVETHLNNAKLKLNCKSLTELVSIISKYIE